MLPILNRDFVHPADGWYHIEAAGTHPNRSAGVIQILDDTARVSIVNRFNAEYGKPDSPGMLIDHEHFSTDADKETIAYGWLQELQNRADGLYGRIRWTATGKAAVDGGDYRFFSTDYTGADLQILNREKPQQIRPLELMGLTLTNKPRNKGQKPITNREDSRPSATSACAAAAADTNPPQKTQRMKTVSTLLGLAEDAAEAAVRAEVVKLKNRVTELEGEQVKLTNRAITAETRIKVIETEQADLAVTPLRNRGFGEAEIATARDLYLTNRNAFDLLIKSIGEEEAPAKVSNTTAAPVLRNRATPPANTTGNKSNPAAAQAAVKAFQLQNRCTYEEAHAQVLSTRPELFGLA